MRRAIRLRILPASLLRALLCWLLPLTLASGAEAQQAGAQQAAASQLSSVELCHAFRKEPDGTWIAIRPVTVKIDSWKISAAANTVYRRDAIRLNGVDFAEFLDDRCGPR